MPTLAFASAATLPLALPANGERSLLHPPAGQRLRDQPRGAQAGPGEL